MNKEQALERLILLENEAKELRNIIEQPEVKKPTAEEWLLNFIRSNRFTTEFGKDSITHYLDGQWIFTLDLKNKYLWCYYYKVWDVFYKEYSMDYKAVKDLYKNLVGDPLNCKGFTPRVISCTHAFLVGHPLKF